MARYIDLDIAIKAAAMAVHDQITAVDVVTALEEAPPADVAPRAEVAREICCKIEEEIVAALESNYRARKEHIERHAELAYDTELLLEINGKINALRGIEGFVEELKKKYAEGEK